ncbi:unnamed protein product [Heligmosomoides polygyrus]|uniref:Hexosyltransferase n=1 Tax=Heligmosomoides polygyrus TaxID=6339 RepID=A0A183FLM1_HELPZ|nr:unnamed protein product [Heligmosomoides polygyrus]
MGEAVIIGAEESKVDEYSTDPELELLLSTMPGSARTMPTLPRSEMLFTTEHQLRSGLIAGDLLLLAAADGALHGSRDRGSSCITCPVRPPLKVLGSNRTTPNSTQKALTYAKTHKSRYFHVSRIPNAEAVVSHTKSPPPSHSRSDSSTRSKHVSEPPDVAQKPPSLGERQLNIALSLTPPTKPDEVPSPTALPESPLDDFFMLKEGTNSSQAPDLTRTTYSHAGREQLNSRVTPSAAEIFTEVKTMEASEPSTSALSPPVYELCCWQKNAKENFQINSPDVEMGASLSNNASASRNGSSTDDRDEVDRTGSPDFQKSSPAQTVPPPYHLSYVQREFQMLLYSCQMIQPRPFRTVYAVDDDFVHINVKFIVSVVHVLKLHPVDYVEHCKGGQLNSTLPDIN